MSDRECMFPKFADYDFVATFINKLHTTHPTIATLVGLHPLMASI